MSNILSAADPDKLTGALTTISEGGTVFDVKLIERLGRIRQAKPIDIRQPPTSVFSEKHDRLS